MAEGGNTRYRPPVFTGEEREWSEWAFRMRACAAELHEDMDCLMAHVERKSGPIGLASLRPEKVALARRLINLLIRSTGGPPFRFHQCRRSQRNT